MDGGWLHTGDVARMDNEGYFAIVDRLKDRINTAGFKVWPREVEEVLYAHPSVRQAVVYGQPDDYRGEIVKACVLTKGNEKAGSRKPISLRSAANAWPATKYPARWNFGTNCPLPPRARSFDGSCATNRIDKRYNIPGRGDSG